MRAEEGIHRLPQTRDTRPNLKAARRRHRGEIQGARRRPSSAAKPRLHVERDARSKTSRASAATSSASLTCSIVSGVDHFGEEPRFEVVYELYHFEPGEHLRLKIPCPKTNSKSRPSPTSGPRPTGTSARLTTCTASSSPAIPNLRRILMWEGYPFFPLRKDFPLAGQVQRHARRGLLQSRAARRRPVRHRAHHGDHEGSRAALALGGVSCGRRQFRGAHSSRVLVLASPPKRTFGKGATAITRSARSAGPLKVRPGGTPAPTLGTSVLPGFPRPHPLRPALA